MAKITYESAETASLKAKIREIEKTIEDEGEAGVTLEDLACAIDELAQIVGEING